MFAALVGTSIPPGGQSSYISSFRETIMVLLCLSSQQRSKVSVQSGPARINSSGRVELGDMEQTAAGISLYFSPCESINTIGLPRDVTWRQPRACRSRRRAPGTATMPGNRRIRYIIPAAPWASQERGTVIITVEGGSGGERPAAAAAAAAIQIPETYLFRIRLLLGLLRFQRLWLRGLERYPLRQVNPASAAAWLAVSCAAAAGRF